MITRLPATVLRSISLLSSSSPLLRKRAAAAVSLVNSEPCSTRFDNVANIYTGLLAKSPLSWQHRQYRALVHHAAVVMAKK